MLDAPVGIAAGVAVTADEPAVAVGTTADGRAVDKEWPKADTRDVEAQAQKANKQSEDARRGGFVLEMARHAVGIAVGLARGPG